MRDEGALPDQKQNSKETLPNPFDLSGLDNLQDSLVLEGLEREMNHNSENINRNPNFPPFLPVIDVNIASDIPSRKQLQIYMMFASAISFSLSLIFSILVSLFSSSLSENSSLASMHWWKELIMSIFHAAVFPAALFYVQFWPWYKAIRDESGYQSMATIQIFVIVVHAIFVLGLPGTGMIGVVYLVAAFSSGGTVLTALSAVVSIWHALNLVLQFVIYAFLKTSEQEGNLLLGEQDKKLVV